MRGKSKNKPKIKSWKEKAKERIKIIAYKNKRELEIKKGRESWKAKYFNLRACYEDQQRELDGLKYKLITPVDFHSYGAEVMQLSLQLRTNGNCSLRSCVKVLEMLVLILKLEFQIPCFSTIRNWEIKLGYEQIQKRSSPTDKWVLIIDESISIGSQKMLLLLGVNLKDYEFDRAFSLVDVEILSIRLNKSWKSPEIKQVMEEVLDRGYQFEYCCCDNGSNLVKFLELVDLTHIEDCGHALGKWLEHKYSKAEEYIDFCAATTKMKRQLIQSKYAEFVPPKQRHKGRFLNLSDISIWSKKLLLLAKKYQQDEEKQGAFEKIKWILEHEPFILNLNKEQKLINQVNKVIKKEGLSKDTIVQCQKLMENSPADGKLKEHIQSYLGRNWDKLPDLESIICSSDIIESIFGKFKYNTSKSPHRAISEGCLSVANYGKSFKLKEIKRAMENNKMADIKQWRKENLPISIQQKKRKVFQKVS